MENIPSFMKTALCSTVITFGISVELLPNKLIRCKKKVQVRCKAIREVGIPFGPLTSSYQMLMLRF